MTFADDLKPLVLEALGAGVGAAIREFADREPDAATKAKAIAQTVDQILALMPVEELREHLTDDGAARAELAFAIAKAARANS